jgi:hypothetical protein
MTRLESILYQIKNAKREYRDKAANQVLNNSEFTEELVQLALDSSSEFHVKAAWTLELVFLAIPAKIAPHLNFLCSKLDSIKNESALRPIAKICSGLVAKERKNQPKFLLTTEQKEKIIEACFDWLISDTKTATQVFAMDSIYSCSGEFPWVKESLKEVLQKDISSKSHGYVSRARKILQKIENEQNN